MSLGRGQRAHLDPARRGLTENEVEGEGGPTLVSAAPLDLGTSLQDAQVCAGQTVVSGENLVAGLLSCSSWSGRLRGRGSCPALPQPEHQSRQQTAPARR